VLREKEERVFEVPNVGSQSLVSFFSKYARTEYSPISISVIPGGHVYSDGAVFSPDGTTLACDLSLTSSHYLCGRRIHRPLMLTGNTLSVASWRTRSYYHWLLDELPRYLLPDIPAFDQIVCSRDSNVNREALRIMGLEDKKVLFLDKAKHFQCDLLISPSYVTPTGEPSLFVVALLKEAI
jgi:hypothetical protein